MALPSTVAAQRSTGVGDIPRERLMLSGLDDGVDGSVREDPPFVPVVGRRHRAFEL